MNYSAADDKRGLDMIGHDLDHALGDRSLRAATAVHVDQFHSEHLTGHGGTHRDLVFVPGNRRRITDIGHRGGGAAIDDDITGGHDLEPALPHEGSRYHVLADQ